MEVGLIGLGRMGANMAIRLRRGGHRVIVYNRTVAKARELAAEHDLIAAEELSDLVAMLTPPRVVWLMLPAGSATDEHLAALTPLLTPGDIVIDGANNNYKASIAHAEQLTAQGLRFLDIGVSGGIWGLQIGYCLMVGGDEETFHYVEPLLQTLAPPEGYLLCGPHGAGHFVKMIHNGIEYGMMQAYAEGFEILRQSRYDFDLAKISHLWNQGSVVRSWLLELAERAFTADADLSSIRGYVEDSGEGRWTVQESIDLDVPAPIITLSLQMRFRSRQEDSFSMKVLAALRQQFGGHAVKKVE
ncbi:MAG TPA: decarboxylating 6-phosphogluconate dehydrogenase [Chloroflexus aurantiacus]|uniref:6-phosphogluconate dehydrogenase, decarboxylating n=1 Tax=Chloroflexus aurantiacus (strain ATCC 29366 / DSM 635 / J-10-fl) TaxID=324602 RepID=A9WE88_CHLAA|nr:MULTISPECIES: decarboxylating 6-phosphogluconate dehydrogenase [Chloroflexus]ABY33748.1 6-phosphogluconate dehydrogenase, decarboxylating [Chloroflexus aurantiacus J-10-fl]RMG49937.1 MAG: decarboxylating 6-phosphogluconate dehydrogenase [Chloroflexota bacterium]GIV94377.1 MAG: 6-phosphogluconate dehydrogenase [Chloroflexus sp.]HBW68196.1 decarboxylating 6-phosphogluconate dehydrogenase [Chloroflexus aurantiacus]